ncbi:MAG: hypothetical protein K2X93_13825 [Candidatus Obscuribacterales bacterium]|nr:hypothetical protein [Candidatus Obscuribacterales bacterium]
MTTRDPRHLIQAGAERGNVAILHLRFEGRSREIALDILDVGPASTDERIAQAVASYLDVSVAKLRGYVVERHDNGNITMRPEAVFG